MSANTKQEAAVVGRRNLTTPAGPPLPTEDVGPGRQRCGSEWGRVDPPFPSDSDAWTWPPVERVRETLPVRRSWRRRTAPPCSGDLAKVDRFLVLGTAGATRVVGGASWDPASRQSLLGCVERHAAKVLDRVVEASMSGRLPSNDPAIDLLALVVVCGDDRARALAEGSLRRVCRTAAHLLRFLRTTRALSGGTPVEDGLPGRSRGGWEVRGAAVGPALPCVPMRTRDSWTSVCAQTSVALPLPTALALAGERWGTGHEGPPMGPACDTIAVAAAGFPERWDLDEDPVPRPWPPVAGLEELLEATTAVRRSASVREVVHRVGEHRLPVESVPARWLAEPDVWEALLPGMPLGVLVREVGRMTAAGFLTPGGAGLGAVVARLKQPGAFGVSGLHPLALYAARRAYASGGARSGRRGVWNWEPLPELSQALEAAFTLALRAVPRVGKPVLVALDVSGSMASTLLSGAGLSAREAAVALAQIVVSTEPGSVVVGFASPTSGVPGDPGAAGLTLLDLTPGASVEEALGRVAGLPFGRTDCSLPLTWARRHRLEVAGVITLTDLVISPTGAAVREALRRYREECNPSARLVTVGMGHSTAFGLADPEDPGMLDLAGFDTSVPLLLTEFLRG